MVSLESPSSAEYGMKKFQFSYRELSGFTVLRILDVIQLFLFTFLTKFLSILTKLLSISLKYVKINC